MMPTVWTVEVKKHYQIFLGNQNLLYLHTKYILGILYTDNK